MPQTVWKDAAGRARLEEWFERFRRRIAAPVESREVATRLGPSHVLVGGPPDAPPLVCLHAMRTGSAFLLAELGPLLTRFRVIAPDVPGQSVRGPQTRLPLHDDSYALWLGDVLDAFELPQTDLFGISFGGFVARQLASRTPERVRNLALLVPAGIANGSHWLGLTRMALPLLRYRIWKTPENLRRFLDPLLTTWDDDWAGYMGDTLRDMPLDLRIPPLASDADLKRLTMPLLALGASDDISFPGDPVVRRLQAVGANVQGEVIPNCKHCPPTTPAFQTWLADRLTQFFMGGDPGRAAAPPVS